MSTLKALAVVVALAATAAAAPRVEVADPDPELVHAIEAALAPWKLEITVVRSAPIDDADARARADAETARFIVWREGSTLVVYDRERDTAERRPARLGAFDPATAAAAAATVKTMMRLPPPADAAAVAPLPPPFIESSHVEVRFEAGGGARYAGGGSDSAGGARALVAAMVRPTSERPFRFGVRADLGTDASIDQSGFTGAWSDWSVLAAASFAIERGVWEVEPWLGGGVTRGHLDGKQMATARSESATLATIAAGGVLRHRWGAFTAGAAISIALTPKPPTYTKDNNGNGNGMPEVFQASEYSLVFAVLAAIDLGR